MGGRQNKRQSKKAHCLKYKKEMETGEKPGKEAPRLKTLSTELSIYFRIILFIHY